LYQLMSLNFYTIVVKISYKKSYKELVHKDTVKWERFGNVSVQQTEELEVEYGKMELVFTFHIYFR